MIGPPSGARVWIAAGATDLRPGFTGLSAAVQMVLERDPFGGHVFVFRAGERGSFVWPKAESGTVSLTRAQLSVLLDGIDWRQPARAWKPEMAV